MRSHDLLPLLVVVLGGLFCVLVAVADRAIELHGVCPPPSTIFGPPDRMESEVNP